MTKEYITAAIASGALCFTAGVQCEKYVSKTQETQDYDKICGHLKKIDAGLEEAQSRLEEMSAGQIEGVTGSSRVEGLRDLFGGVEPTERPNLPGLPGDTGVGHLFPGPGQPQTQNYNSARENYEQALEYARQIHENARAGIEALEQGRAALARGGGSVPTGPDPLRIPDIPIIPQENAAYETLRVVEENLREMNTDLEESLRLLEGSSDIIPETPGFFDETRDAYETLQEVRQYIREGIEALEAGVEALEGTGDGVTHGPDVPVIPNAEEELQRAYDRLEEMEENVREGREALRDAMDMLRTGSEGVPEVPRMPEEPRGTVTEEGQ